MVLSLMPRRWDRTDSKRPVCVERMRERKCEGEEGQGTAEACVIVLPQSFDPGCGSCCYLQHLYLIRGKWVVRKKKLLHHDLLLSSLIFLFSELWCIALMCPLSSCSLYTLVFSSSLHTTVYLQCEVWKHTTFISQRPKPLRLPTVF